MIRSMPNDHPGCLACRLSILPGHRHMPLPKGEGYFYTTYDGTSWPGLSVPSDWKRKG